MKIILLQKSDYREVLWIISETMLPFLNEKFGHNKEWLKNDLSWRYKESVNDEMAYWIRVDNTIVWFFLLWIKEDRILHIKELHVKKSEQWMWFGTQCFDFIENIAKERKLDSIWLTVYKENRAANLYKKLWFEIVWEKLEWSAYKMKKRVKQKNWDDYIK